MSNVIINKINLWAIIGFFVTSILGTLLHFLYDWTNCPFLALFSAVNESTWEHMKIFFFPTFFFAIAEYFIFGKRRPDFWEIKLLSTLLGLLLIPTLFYTIRGAFGSTPDWVNITLFFVVTAIAYYYEAKQFKTPRLSLRDAWAFALLCLIAIIFCLFTALTPRIPLFQDPVDGTFGLNILTSLGRYATL